MDCDEALKLLRGGTEGVRRWNDHRQERPNDVFDGGDLDGVNLSAANLTGADLKGVKLRRADLFRVSLIGADLRKTYFNGANLGWAVLRMTDLRGADLRGADLRAAQLKGADLRGADLRGAQLRGADLSGATLGDVMLEGATFHETILGNLDLSEVRGLDSVRHFGPSSVGVDTLICSKGRIPEAFLRGCGVPDSWIANLPALLGSLSPIQFYSCFLSHSSADKDFARRLHSRMRDEGLRVWFDEVDMQSGRKLHEQIDEAIRLHDKLLIVLSPHSMGSEWVKTELRKAFKQERKEGLRKLFPISVVPYAEVKEWECFDADHGKDLAVEVREYFIPDFSNWKDNDAFEAASARLLRDLMAEGERGSG